MKYDVYYRYANGTEGLHKPLDDRDTAFLEANRYKESGADSVFIIRGEEGINHLESVICHSSGAEREFGPVLEVDVGDERRDIAQVLSGLRRQR